MDMFRGETVIEGCHKYNFQENGKEEGQRGGSRVYVCSEGS